MTSDTRIGDYYLVLNPKDLLDRKGHLLGATLRLSGHRGPTELPVTLDVDAAQGQSVVISGFVLASLAAFADRVEEVLSYVADQTRQEAAACAAEFITEGFDLAAEGARQKAVPGIGVGDVGAVVAEVFFGRKRVPTDEGVKKMKEVLYPELTEEEVRALHDRPATQDKYDVEVTVPWDEEHIRLFRYRDGECVELSAT